MLKLKDVPEENMGEVIRSAAETQMREQDEARQKSATVAAAEEMGISEHYLDRAARELHAKKVHEVQTRRRRNNVIGATVVAIGAVAGFAWLNQPAPPLAVGITPTAVTSRVNAQTEASVQAVNGAAVITVNRFAEDPLGHYYANAEITGPTSVSSYREIKFTASGNGGLTQVRIDLENGSERFKGPVVSVSQQPHTHTLRLEQFQRQKFTGKGGAPVAQTGKPGTIQRITVKTGETINPPNATGTIEIRDLIFK